MHMHDPQASDLPASDPPASEVPDAPPPWWQGPGTLERLVADLIEAELRALRPGMPPPARPWPPGQALGEGGLGLDSLDLLTVAGALSELLQLHESGLDDYLLARRGFGDWLHVARAALARHDRALTFRTSGSTGEPRRCTHPLARLEAEAAFWGALLAGRRRVLAAVPAHHIYGMIFTVLLPRHLAGAEVLDIRGRSPAALRALLRPGDLVVGHPAWWTAVARGLPEGVPEDVTGITSTAPCPEATARAVTAAGFARLVQVYGSSETAGIGWREAPDAPYELLPAWRRGEQELLREDELIPWPDRLDWKDERHFGVLGRRDGAVQVGGVNVHPERIAAVLREHPAVAQAAVRLMRPEEGSRLKAFVVPHGPGADEDALRASLAAQVEARLPPPERPRAFTFGPAIPLTPMGKLADWSVPLSR